jgi:hypothetical protein
VFGTAAGERELPGGGVQLVDQIVGALAGTFDAHGVFVQAIADARFAQEGDRLFAQGAQPMSGGAGSELSAGLELRRRPRECAPPPAAVAEPAAILVEEFADLMRTGAFETALDVALNSKGDALTLDLNGSLAVPIVVVPGVTVGGKAALKAAIKRGEDTVGAVVYDLAIGADVAATAGVGVTVAGVTASQGGGMDVIWRFASVHDLARGIRSMLILQAVADRIEMACLALDTQLEKIDRAIDSARRAADGFRAAVRVRMPWRDNPLVRALQCRQDELRAQRRELADRARRNVEWLIGQVADARIFLITHQHGYEVRRTIGIEGSVGAGFGDADKGGEVSGANFGASLAAGIEQQIVLRAERVPESEALAFERKVILTKSIVASAGVGVGFNGASKRVVELTTRLQMGRDGLQADGSGTTVRLTLDNKVLLALGAICTGQAGIGREITLQLRLADLLGYSKDALAILLGDDEHRIAQMLLAFPIEFSVRGRYEAGFAFGFGLDIKGVCKFGVGASAMMSDCSLGFEYRGGSGASFDAGNTVPQMLIAALQGALLNGAASVQHKLHAVGDEVARVARR